MVKELTSEDLNKRISLLKTMIEKESLSSDVQDMVINNCMDSLLKRYLTARDYNVDKAFAMLKKTCEWRNDNCISKILNKHHLDATKRETFRKAYPQGFHKTDKKGHPIWIERAGHMDLPKLLSSCTVEDVVQNHIQIMEYQQKVLLPKLSTQKNRTIDKITVIHDLHNAGRHTFRKEVFQFIQQVSQIDQDHYPESLHKLYIVNAPFLFHGIWKMIQVFLNENTRRKIRILGSNYHKEIQEDIDLENLPVFLGGHCECSKGKKHNGCVTSAECTQTSFLTDFDKSIFQDSS